MATQLFGKLPVGARFRYEGELYTKAEHDLRSGMLHCSNAVSDAGTWALIEPQEPVEAIGHPPER
ncbi:MAG: hypothetical protein M0Z66_09100 [Thermaerobacter sp.]|nr:hypothetical protein [Thermaerobacter sp.]